MLPGSTTRTALAIVFLLASVTAAWASGATFAITGVGISLSEGKDVEEGGKELQRFLGKAIVGKPLTLVAQGMILPRGGVPVAGEPEAGVWSFDEKQLKKLALAAAADKTKIVIRLEPLVAGPARVRFAGKILGYERAFEVSIDVAEAK